MRSFLLLASAFLVGITWSSAESGDQAAPVRRIFVSGGGFLSGDPEYRQLRYILALTGKKDPIVYDLPTASGDNLERIAMWYEIMNDLPCRPRHVRLFGPTAKARDYAKQLLSADAIVIPGGNCLNMVAVWRAQGLDAILRTAWERGIVLAGESAGMNCWFEQALGDSRPERFSTFEFLGWLKGSACPHYHDNAGQWRKAYRDYIASGELRDGLAVDSGAGVLFEGERITRVVTTSSEARAYRVRRAGNDVVEEPLQAELLSHAR